MEIWQESLAEIAVGQESAVEDTQIDLPINRLHPGRVDHRSDEKMAAIPRARLRRPRAELLELAADWIDRYAPCGAVNRPAA